jgi:exopolysaccharide production protein ExoF
MAVTAFVLAFVPLVAGAQDRLVSAGDDISLRVLTWDQVEGTVADWTALSGDYRVRPDGFLDLPFIPPLRAEGRTTAAIGEAVAAALAEELALSGRPDATVTLRGHRPVLVSGLVRNPGQVDFMPGMTVRHAIALAGGPEQTLRRGTDAFREMINAQGNFRLLVLERTRLRTRLARLRAERSGLDDIVAPADLSGPDVGRLLSEQAEIMERRRERLASERRSLEDRITLLEREIATLEQRAASLDRQRDLAREAREGIASLADEGLAVNSRVLNSEQTLALVENQVLETSTAILRARLDLAAAEREVSDLQFLRRTELVEQMQETQARLSDVEQRIETANAVLDIDGLRVAEMLEDGAATGPGAQVEPSYRIFRADGSDIDAQPGTPLEPGDLVEMRRPDRARAGSIGPASD